MKGESGIIRSQLRTVSDEGTEHNGVFHAFALVDGNDFDRVFVAFQAELMFFEPRGLRVSLSGRAI